MWAMKYFFSNLFLCQVITEVLKTYKKVISVIIQEKTREHKKYSKDKDIYVKSKFSLTRLSLKGSHHFDAP